ncbi:NB-ARC domain-containing protein [Pleurocapsa sp. PCC 7319]|uniref:NB-ARC domain-containing protein n=1 Tax=Pleurocapsa sp. PCC 7319 TaxID=118161 RepID=UPI00034AF72D|nr:NB-ARC domain-containing protein [Pleurocapsa sp. PCC 7319]
MNADEALAIVDRLLGSEKLNNLQELIFLQSWQHMTYQEIAAKYAYSDDYIRDNGAQLWQLLSRIFNEKINKTNFKSVIERHLRQQKIVTSNNNQDWEEAIDVSFFYGREQELELLQKWIIGDREASTKLCGTSRRHRCRMIGIFGMGGMGKTSLAAKLAQQIASEFDFIIWRSLRNETSLEKLLTSIVDFIAQQVGIEISWPPDIGSRISLLIEYLRSYRCLIILDNGETILQSGIICGNYREEYQDYRKLFQLLGAISVESCVILTSREKLQEFSSLEGNATSVRSLQIKGLGAEVSRNICQLKGEFRGLEQDWQTLTDNYSGNPLALKIVAATIKDLFDGDVNQFLQQEIIFFDDLADLLEEQFVRLSRLEQEIMYWLAIVREPISLQKLQQDLLSSFPPKKLIEAVKSLIRRSLIENTATGFTQQPIFREYLLIRQSEKIAAELEIECC